MPKSKELNKSLNPLDIWSLALGSIIGWGAFIMPGALYLPSAGPLGVAIGMLIGALIMITIAFSYGFMIEKLSSAGGEFIYTKEGYNNTHAFICAWFLGLSYISIVPLNATALGLVGRFLFPGILQQGYLYTIAGWEVYVGEILLASLALILLAATSIRGTKSSFGKIQTIMTLILVISIVLICLFSYFNENSSLKNLYPLFSPLNTSIGGVLAIVSIAPWAYLGFGSIPQASEEFNFNPKKARNIMILSIMFGGLLFIALNTVTAYVFPWYDFISEKPSWATGKAIEHIMGPMGLFLLGIALVSAILSGIVGFYMASSRLLLSLARAKAIPNWFAFIHPKFKTPSHAIIFVMLISLLTPWFGRQVLIWIVDMASIGAAIGYFYTTSSALILLKTEQGHLLTKFFSFLGTLFSIGFIILLLNPYGNSFLSFPSRIALIAWSFLGIAFYALSFKRFK